MVIKWYKLINYFHFSRAALGEAIFSILGLGLVRLYLVLLLILNLINWFFAFYVSKNVSQSLIILHYNVDLGVNLIGGVANIYIIPALGLAFIFINFLLLINIYRQSKFLIHLVLSFSLLVNFFLVASTISVYLINFR